MNPVVIIGCGASKHDLAGGVRVPIVELYKGSLWRARLEYARALGGPHYVASGLYGLVPANEMVGSYELDLRKKDPEHRESWVDGVLGALLRHRIPREHVVALVAGPYAAWVPIARENGWRVEVPAAGLELGPSLALLRSDAKKLRDRRVQRPDDLAELARDFGWEADEIEAELARDNPPDGDTWDVTTGALRLLLARSFDAGRQAETATSAGPCGPAVDAVGRATCSP